MLSLSKSYKRSKSVERRQSVNVKYRMSEKNVLSGTLGVEATKSFKINLHLLVR